jgi:hypothetical protein
MYKLNMERINKLATVLYHMPEKNFFIGDWMSHAAEKYTDAADVAAANQHYCGTVACVAGWAVQLAADEFEVERHTKDADTGLLRHKSPLALMRSVLRVLGADDCVGSPTINSMWVTTAAAYLGMHPLHASALFYTDGAVFNGRFLDIDGHRMYRMALASVNAWHGHVSPYNAYTVLDMYIRHPREVFQLALKFGDTLPDKLNAEIEEYISSFEGMDGVCVDYNYRPPVSHDHTTDAAQSS